ncbi:MAG: response regulator [Myxococcaceae bacterium]|nr:response regulator [Myxococcaceae bacterium]
MTPRVLVVEDEVLVAEDLRRTLVRLGYEVPATTGDGSEAVALTEALKPALVLMDIHLAGPMDGIEAARLVRERHDVPVVFLTAYSDDATLERAKVVEPLSYLLKPFDERELKSAIEVGLYVHRLARERRAMLENVRHQERLASLGTLAAGLAHEVNNPLTVVKLNTEVARQAVQQLDVALRDEVAWRATPPLAELATLDEALGETDAATDRIRQIVDDVRRFARAESHKAGPLAVSHVVARATALARRTVEDRAHLVVEHQPAPLVQASESLLVQVLLNLLINAAQAMEGRARAACLIQVRTGTATDGRARIDVEDNGSGIAPEALPHIFDPFFTTKPVGVGTGLGLSISHGIVTSHGGELRVESSLGRGTTMTVLLPALARG